MLITNEFVMLNFPKTGSSFAREAVKRLYGDIKQGNSQNIDVDNELMGNSAIELMLPKIDEENHYSIVDQHGTYRQIPQLHRNKPIVSVVRNPVSRAWSAYKYQWWAKHPPAHLSELLKKYPDFPQISFSEYCEIMHTYGRENRLQGIHTKIDLGIQTIQFVQFFFKNPREVLATIDDDYIESKQYMDDMAPVRFLHQENLRNELIHFLITAGVPQSRVEFISDMDDINVTESKLWSNDKPGSLDRALKNRMLKQEKLLFSIFPEYAVHLEQEEERITE